METMSPDNTSNTSKSSTKKRQRWLPFRLRVPLPGIPGIPGLRLPRLPGSGRSSSSNSSSSQAGAPALAGGASALALTADASGAAAAAGSTSTGGKANKPPLKPASDVLAGALARALSQSTIHPLDTLKVRLQTAGHLAASSSARAPAAGPAVRGLSKFGQLVPPPASGPGLKAMGASLASLYKGVLGAASGAGIAIGAYFACYGLACNMVSSHTDLGPSAVAFVSGGLAAAGSSVVKVPLAVCIRSVQAGVYPNVFAAASSITAKAGTAGLFTGFFPTLLEDVPDMAVKFAAYESLRQLHRRLNQGRAASPQEDFAMGAFAGALAAAATTPLDVIKTRMMCAAASRPTMVGAAREIMAAAGPKGFAAGIGTRALSNGINSAVFFCFFEALRSAMQAKAHLSAGEALQAWAAQAAARAAAIPRLLAPPGGISGQLPHLRWAAAGGASSMGLLAGGAGGCGGAGATLALAGGGGGTTLDLDEGEQLLLAGPDGALGLDCGIAQRRVRPALSLSLLARASPLRLEDSQLVMAMQALKSVEESTNPLPLDEE